MGGWNLRRLTFFYVLNMWGMGEDSSSREILFQVSSIRVR